MKRLNNTARDGCLCGRRDQRRQINLDQCYYPRNHRGQGCHYDFTFPGTTLDKIEIPLDDGSYIYDTPGIIHRHQMAHYLTAKTSSISALGKKSSQRPTNSIQNKPCSWQVWDDLTLWLVNAKALLPSLTMNCSSTALSYRG